MTCDDADLLLAAYAVGALEADDHALLRAHLAGCEPCRESGARYVAAAGLLPLGVDVVAPPPALRSRIVSRVHAEAAGEAAPRPRWYRRLWSSIPAGRGLTIAGAGAALAAVAAAVVAGVLLHRSTPPATLTARSCGLTAQPAACGTLIYVPDAQKSILTVDGLAPIPVVDNRAAGMYEVWLIRSDGAPTASAFLTASPDGKRWSATLDGDISQFVAVATTREPAGGSEYPRGTEVFRVAVPVR